MSDGTSVTERAAKLKKRIQTTSYARFDAHKRVNRLNSSSLLALTSASLLLIYLEIIKVYSTTNDTQTLSKFFDVFPVLASIAILVLSLVVTFAEYGLRSERYFKSGNEMKSLCDELELLNNSNNRKLKKISKKYSDLREYSENHQGFNYKRGKIERQKEDDVSEDDLTSLTKSECFFYWLPIICFHFITFSAFIIFCISLCKYF